MIDTYFKSKNSGEIYYKQLALNDHNVVGLLFFLIKIELDLNKDESLRLTLHSLTSLCKDNFSTQGQLFVSPHNKIFQELHEHNPLLATIATTNIFQNDNQILYSNPEIFNVIFDLYKDKFDDFEDLFSIKTAGELDAYDNQNELNKERIDWILAIDTFNKYFLHLLSNP